MGWKVARSDRMVSFYGGMWLFALLRLPLRCRALGSFTAWMRILTGLSAGLGLVWFMFPPLDGVLTYGTVGQVET